MTKRSFRMVRMPETCQLFNKAARYGFGLLFLIFALAFNAQAQTLRRATSGSGAYKQSIWWLDFKDLELPAGESVTQTYSVENGLYTLVVTIDEISFGGTLANNTNISSQRLIGYASGTYVGDGLVQLYNIGVPNNGATGYDRVKNTLMNALSLKYDGNYSGEGNEAKANFRVRAYAYLNGSNAPIDVGMVFADAETDEPDSYWNYEEYSQGTTNGTPWQVFETALQDPKGEQKVVISGAGQTAKTICGYNELNSNPGNVILMYTKKAITTNADPLNVNMEFKGGGRSATAIGFLHTGTDKSDAPASYGIAQNIFFSTILGGSLATNGTYYITSKSTTYPLGGTPLVTKGTMGYPETPRLGALAGDPDSYTTIPGVGADLDNTTGVNDEDALTTIPAITTRNTTYALTFNATTASGQNAYINGWMDFNRNGNFDDAEFLTKTITAAGNVTLNWNGISPKAGPTYLRLRIQSNVAGTSAGASDIKMGGETEDYLVNVTTFISGNVYHDANGMNGSPANTVDGTGINSASGEPLYVSLLDASGNLVKQVAVQSDGSYEISGVLVGDYTTILTTDVNGTTPKLPADWINTGEHIGADAGSDGTTDGKISVSIAAGDVEKTAVNFGIEQGPESYDVAKAIDGAPVIDQLIPLTDMPLMGSDPEDLPLPTGNTTGQAWTGRALNITSMPTNGFVLIYDSHEITATDIGTTGYLIANYDPTKLQIKAVSTPGGIDETTFYYATIDQAGEIDPTPAKAVITFSKSLPVRFGAIMAKFEDGLLLVNWKSVSETNNDHFEIEASADGYRFVKIGELKSKAPGGNSDQAIDYEFSGTIPQSLLAGLSVLALIAVAGNPRRKLIWLGLLVTFVIATYSCNKTGKDLLDSKSSKLFIRIVQVDKDGQKSFSKTVQVLNNGF